MTWVIVRGVKLWQGEAFVDPPDSELEKCGWTNTKANAAQRKEPTATRHPCADCPKLIHRQATRCWECYNRARREAAKNPTITDEIAVQRVLAGDWTLKVGRAETIAVAKAWVKEGRSTKLLAALTGWKVDRYVRVKDERQRAAAGPTHRGPDCLPEIFAWSDADVRAAHSAFVKGDLNVWTREGERLYKRAAQRRARAKKRAA